MSGHQAPQVDPLKKLMIVLVLVLALMGLHAFGAASHAGLDPTGLLALGFVVLAAYSVGQLSGLVGLPHITGYLLAGMVLGPSVAHMVHLGPEYRPFDEGVLRASVQEQLGLLKVLATGLIALTAGGELKLDALRQGVKQIGALLVAQTLTILVGISVFFWAISVGVPLIAIPQLAALGPAGALALGATVAAFSLATSPAATIAVINETNAKGPMTRLVLSTVVLMDVFVVVLFSVFSALAGMALGLSASHGSLASYLFVHVVVSMGVGALLAGALGAYIRYIGHEILLVLVGLIYIGSYAAEHAVPGASLDPLLMFLAAGFVASNFTSQGDALIHTVEKVSLPVYVVFFALAGAHLPLDEVVGVLPYALALVLVRGGALWLGVRVGAVVSGADDNTRTLAWAGFVSQAGISLLLAEKLRETYAHVGGEGADSVGAQVATLLVAGVAIHEVIGPVLFKLALVRAGEAGHSPDAYGDADGTDYTADTGVTHLAPWEPPESVDNPWGERLQLGSDALNRHAADLEVEFQGLVRDLMLGPLEHFRSRSDHYYRLLRRELLRHHRKAQQLASAALTPEDRVAALRSEQAEVARRWRAVVLDRAAQIAEDDWTPIGLVDVLDQAVESLPLTVYAPWEDGAFAVRADDGRLQHALRTWLRARRRLAELGGGALAPRTVMLRDLARFHVGGLAVARMEGVAALLVAAERHVADRTRSLFDSYVFGYERIITALREGEEVDLDAALGVVREEVDLEFDLARDELDHVVTGGAVRLARVLGTALVGLKADLGVAGGPDLARRSRRYSLVFGERSATLQRLATGMSDAWLLTAAQYRSLGLELELVGLEGAVKDQLHNRATELSRRVRGRGPVQLQRVLVALDDALGVLDQVLPQPNAGAALAAKVRGTTEPLAKVVAEARRESRRLTDELADAGTTEALVDSLLACCESLTERYALPSARVQVGEWALPLPVPVSEVAFRQVVVEYVEVTVSRNLQQHSRDLALDAQCIVGMLDEVERIVAFNTELAVGELDVLEDERVPAETASLVHDMIIGALGRSRTRLAALADEVVGLPEQARSGLFLAVLEGLEVLRGHITEGRLGELRAGSRLAAARNLAREAEAMGGALGDARRRGFELVLRAVGADRIAVARQLLGLRAPEQALVEPSHFAPPAPAEVLPVVYRRLFSDQALEAGDLLTGRQQEIEHARVALTRGNGGRLRAVAIVGPQGVGKGAVVHALGRSLALRDVARHKLEAPATVADVEAWFATPSADRLHLVEGLEWLYRVEVGGFEPLRRFVRGVVEDAGRNAWLVSATDTVWTYVASVAPLEDAFPEVITLRPLDVQELTQAVLARHGMSGYGLVFSSQEDIGWRLRRLFARGSDHADRNRTAWFRSLHAATRGVVSDALLLWMASIERVDDVEGVVRVGPVARPPMASLRALDEPVLLTLRHVLRQGWIDVAQHAALFHQDQGASAAHLARVRHLGLLVDGKVAGTSRIPGHLKSPLCEVLHERGWMG